MSYEAAREKIPISTKSEGFGTSFWNYPYRGKIQPYRRAGSKEPIHTLPEKKSEQTILIFHDEKIFKKI